MTNPTNPRREHPSTYFVQDRSNLDEMARLHVQDQMLTASMGGVLPEQSEPGKFHTVLDVGCGTGDWLIEVAQAYPDATRLIGVDISAKMLEYARALASAQGLGDRVEFLAMDALRMLEFPGSTFDLVNQRFAFSWIRKWDWPKILSEYQRVCKPGGVIRITEPDIMGISNSAAMGRLGQVQLEAFYQAGHLFALDGGSVLNELSRLLRRHGFRNVQTQAYSTEYRAGTPQWQRFYEDMKHLFKTALPFYQKWTHIPEDYEEIYQQLIIEMQQPAFVTVVKMLTIWGTNAD